MDFNLLFKRLSPRLKLTAAKYRSHAPLLNEDDLYQEACIYLWYKYKDGVPLGINDTYIVRGCQFHLLNHLRKNRRKAVFVSLEEPIDGDALTLKDIIPDQRDSLSCIDRVISIDDIKNNGFTKREKQVFSFLLDGFTVREVGRKLGISHVMVVKLKKSISKKWQKKEKGYQKE